MIPPDISTALPESSMKAIDIYLNYMLRRLTKNGKRLTMVDVSDLVEEKWGVRITSPPYIIGRGPIRFIGAYKNLKGIKCDDVDPLKRFIYHSVDAKDTIMAQWKDMSSNQPPRHIVEAVAIHEAINENHVCLKCHSKKSLLWNSNTKCSFSNIVCKKCQSRYTFLVTESCLNLLEKGSALKGSNFKAYCNDLKQLGPSSKMFAVVVHMPSLFFIPAYDA